MSIIFTTKGLNFDYICIKSGYTRRLIKNGKDFLSSYYSEDDYSENDYPEVCAIVDYEWSNTKKSETTVWYDLHLKNDIDESKNINNIFSEGIVIFKRKTVNSENNYFSFNDVKLLMSLLENEVDFCTCFGMKNLYDIEIVKLLSGKTVGVFYVDAESG